MHAFGKRDRGFRRRFRVPAKVAVAFAAASNLVASVLHLTRIGEVQSRVARYVANLSDARVAVGVLRSVDSIVSAASLMALSLMLFALFMFWLAYLVTED